MESEQATMLRFQEKLVLAFDNLSTRKILSKGEFLIREGETENNLCLECRG